MGDDWIVADPSILGGKRCIRGTRISVEFALELVASGASLDDIYRAFPHVAREGLAAALQDAARSFKN